MIALEKIRAEIENLTYDFIKCMVNKYAVLQIIDKYAEQEACDKCVYSTKGGYCQYDDIAETIPPLEPCEDDYQTDMDEAWEHAKREPCDDVVSREAVIEIIRYSCLDLSNASATSMMIDNIRELPSVRPQEQTGHWINHILSIECSCCGNKLFADDENENCEDYDAIDDLGYKFCPNCGAKMVEPQESEEQE